MRLRSLEKIPESLTTSPPKKSKLTVNKKKPNKPNSPDHMEEYEESVINELLADFADNPTVQSTSQPVLNIGTQPQRSKSPQPSTSQMYQPNNRVIGNQSILPDLGNDPFDLNIASSNEFNQPRQQELSRPNTFQMNQSIYSTPPPVIPDFDNDLFDPNNDSPIKSTQSNFENMLNNLFDSTDPNIIPNCLQLPGSNK